MKYFTIKELCASSVADKYHIMNHPGLEELDALHWLVSEILDPARERLGEPIYINSGFRSKELNKKVGGVSTSQHCKGEAVDCWCKHMDKLLDILKTLDFDQLIIYKTKGFYHVSYTMRRRNRNQILYK